MKKINKILKVKKADFVSQYLIYFYLSLIIVLLGFFLYYSNASIYNRFLGSFDPLLTIIVSVIIGIVLLYYLKENGYFVIYKSSNVKRYLGLSTIAFLFGLEVIVADICFAKYPADINVPLPKSLLFYPTIGFIVEIFFHLLPLSIGVFILSLFLKSSKSKLVWISIIFVSIIEPIYQMYFAGQDSLIIIIYTGVHVFLFSLTQLYIFKRFDFISMYLFRLVFYAIWHILWGTLRLNLLY